MSDSDRVTLQTRIYLLTLRYTLSCTVAADRYWSLKSKSRPFRNRAQKLDSRGPMQLYGLVSCLYDEKHQGKHVDSPESKTVMVFLRPAKTNY